MSEKEQEQLKQRHSEQLKEVTKRRAKNLIKEIKLAFADNVYQKNEYVSGSAKHNLECEEHQESHNYFADKTWQNILEENSYRKLCGGQSYFNVWAWHYYLPAYLIKCIEYQNFSSHNFMLSKEKDVDVEKRRRNHFALLTSKQCKVIVGYLEMVEEIWKGIDRLFDEWNLDALDYWKKSYQKILAKEKILK